VSVFNLTRGEELTALVMVVVVGLAMITVCVIRGDQGKTLEIPLNNREERRVKKEEQQIQETVTVHLSGEVGRAGVFVMRRGSRVNDLLQLSGVTQNADLDAINRAAPLVDGQHIIVPGKSSRSPTVNPPGGTNEAGKINVNLATQQQLESLPGIGPVLAGKIIEFRSKRRFKQVDDLLEIRGIGPATLEKVRSRVCVE
jgi:competence protein ComEA